MPLVSSWSLNAASIRYVLPPFVVEALASHALSRELYPHAFGYYEAASGHVMQRRENEHEDHLLLYCTQGEGRVSVGAAEAVVRPGMALLLPAGVAHAYAAAESRPWSFYWAHFSGKEAGGFLEPLLQGASHALLAVGPAPLLVQDWRALLENRPAGFDLPPLILAANRLRLILGQLWVAARPASGPRSRMDLGQLRDFMQARLRTPPTLAELADVAGLERFHFAKTFRRLTGHAPLQYFLHLRMASACQWLDRSDMGIADIAAELGYGDAHYFSRQFRQVTGLSPSAYRQLKRG